MRAFANLSTCRAIGMAVGPIPWRDAVAYADRAGLDEEAAEVFVEVISALDADYLAEQRTAKGAPSDG